jgi:hypothetical protein
MEFGSGNAEMRKRKSGMGEKDEGRGRQGKDRRLEDLKVSKVGKD